jgi:hypothetical protein
MRTSWSRQGEKVEGDRRTTNRREGPTTIASGTEPTIRRGNESVTVTREGRLSGRLLSSLRRRRGSCIAQYRLVWIVRWSAGGLILLRRTLRFFALFLFPQYNYSCPFVMSLLLFSNLFCPTSTFSALFSSRLVRLLHTRYSK